MGAVQGVGFRPFAYRLAVEEGLAGSVRNTGAGVSLEVEGSAAAVARFLMRLETEVRPPAMIDQLECEDLAATREAEFSIVASTADGDLSAPVLPDLALCDACRTEVSTPDDRRYRYPFTTCMHCGPRYSIIDAVPYDRERTVMRHFTMCPACQAEYHDPVSRRFHAETNACPDCGPQLVLMDAHGERLATGDKALERAVEALKLGQIVALKGLGGFQLLADARNEVAVARVRQRKHRPDKPFAVMAGSLDEACVFAHASELEAALLQSPAAPIVLLRSRHDSRDPLAHGVSPDNPMTGVMLPCTPLHHLLMAGLGFPVVATSGNRSGEPLAVNDEDALNRLSSIAELFLSHDRPILHPIDDSVVRVIAGRPTVFRSARGYAPLVLSDAEQAKPVLALGGQLKNSLAIGKDGRIILGPHIGDLTSSETRAAFARSANAMTRIHGFEPTTIACDTHPGYYTTRVAEAKGMPVRKAPHHVAHIFGAIVDNGIVGPVLGVAWDGTGHGGDATVWGGEFLLIDGPAWRRIAHFLPFRLPGGEAAVREPRRPALGVLHALYGDRLWAMDSVSLLGQFKMDERELLRAMLERSLNSPLTSSVGRLFDAIAAILGICEQASFEGHAAIALEHAAGRAAQTTTLPLPAFVEGDGLAQVDWRPMLKAMIEAVGRGLSVEELAAGFHEWLAQAALSIARRAGIEQVVLTGGCFQNALLTERSAGYLEEAGFRPFRHSRVPPNDGGLAVGQAAIAARSFMGETA